MSCGTLLVLLVLASENGINVPSWLFAFTGVVWIANIIIAYCLKGR